MVDSFALRFIIGHCVGDYLLQHDWMASNKIRKDWIGYLACALHSFVYSICFAGIVGAGVVTPGKFLLLASFIFLTHFPIDKWSLGKIWMEKILGKKLYPGGNKQPPLTEEVQFRFFFYGFVYVVIDNTMHFILMYYGIKLFFPEILL